MLSHEENELLTGTGPRTAMGEVMLRYWIPAGWRAKLPSRMARRCASGYWAKISWRSATATAGSGPSTNIVHIGAHHCGSGATRGAGCVASVTTENSPSTALASIR